MVRHRLLLMIALGFLGGVVAAQALRPSLLWLVALLSVSFGCLLASERALVSGTVLLGIALGALRLTAFLGDPTHDVSRCIGPAPVTVTGQVMGEPKITRGALTLLLAPSFVAGSDGDVRVTGSVVVHAGRTAFDAKTVPSAGDTLRLTGTLETPLPSTNPGGFDSQSYLARRAVLCTMRVVRRSGVQIISRSDAPSGARSVPAALAAALQANLSSDSAALVLGILLGQRRALPSALLSEFAATGTAHLLATAGLHVGILAWWLERICTRLRCPRRMAALMIIAMLIAYGALTGGRPAVVRAVLVACFYYGAIVFERAPDLPTSLAAAALAILAFQPTALFEVGFQLSFVTVLGLALAMPLWEDTWRSIIVQKIKTRQTRRAARIGIDVLGLSLIAPLMAAPLVAYDFNQWSLVSVPANLLVIPLVALLIPLTIFSLMIALIVPIGSHVVFAILVTPVTRAILGVIGFFAALPGASISIASPDPVVVGLAYALLGGLLFWARVRQIRRGPIWRTAAVSQVP